MKQSSFIFYGLPLLVASTVILLTIPTQIFSNRVFAKSDIRQQTEDLQSYIKETNLIIDQANRGHLTQAYRDEQLSELQKKSTEVYDKFTTYKITPKDENSLKQLGDVVRDYIFIVQQIQTTPKNANLENEKHQLNSLITKLQQLYQHYE